MVRVAGADGGALAEQRLFVFQGVREARGEAEFRLPFDAFGHTDPAAWVTLDARAADGSRLPSWLLFDPVTGIFRGTPPGGGRTSIDVVVTARDGQGREANLAFTLELGIKPSEAEAPVKADRPNTIAEPKARNDAEEDAEADGTADAALADGTSAEKLEKQKPVKAGARPFVEQVRAAKAARDPLLAKILSNSRPAGRSSL
jgi:hypothetical protein